MARSLEPYRDRFLPDQFSRWLEILRQRIRTVPCFVESTGSPEGVIAGQKGDFYFDTSGNVYYYKTTDTGNTGWAVLSVGVTPPGGADTDVQVNNAGSFGGIAATAAGDVLTSNGVGVLPTFQAPPSASPAGATNEIQFNTAGAFDADPFLSVDLTAGSGQSPTLELNGTSGSYRRPTLLINFDASDEGQIDFVEEGLARGHIRYYATGPGGGTDVLRVWSSVNGGPANNSVVELGAENDLKIRVQDEGQEFQNGNMKIASVPSASWPDLVGFGQLFHDSSDGDLKWRTSGGAEFSLTNDLGLSGIAGSITNDQVAVGATTANEIEGSAAFTWEGVLQTMTIGDGTAITNIDLNTLNNGNFEIEFQEAGGARARLAWYASVAGNTDVVRLGSFVPASGPTNSICEFVADNLVQLTLNEQGASLLNGLQMRNRAAAAFGDVVSRAQLYINNTNNIIYRNAIGTEFDLTEGGVSVSGTPVNNQLAIWTAADTIEGDAAVTWSGSIFNVDGAMTIDDSITVNGATTAAINLVSVASNARVSMDGPGPQIRLRQSGAGLDQKIWEINAESEELRFRLSDDAFGNDYDWLTVSRSGTGANVQADDITMLVPNITIGSAAAGSQTNLYNSHDDGLLQISGGVNGNSGANILMYGGTIVNTGDMVFRNDAQTWGRWDETAGDFVFSTGTGIKSETLTIEPEGTSVVGGSRLAERADHSYTPTTAFGEFWVRDDVPCVPMFTNDAGTDFVLNDTGGGGSPWTYTLQTGTSYTAAAGDFVVASNTGTVTITLPAGHSVNDTIIVKKTGASGTVTVDANASETIDGALTFPLSTQYDSVTLISDGTNWLIV